MQFVAKSRKTVTTLVAVTLMFGVFVFVTTAPANAWPAPDVSGDCDNWYVTETAPDRDWTNTAYWTIDGVDGQFDRGDTVEVPDSSDTTERSFRIRWYNDSDRELDTRARTGTRDLSSCEGTTTTTEAPPVVTPPPALACPAGGILWQHPDPLGRNPMLVSWNTTLSTSTPVVAGKYDVATMSWDGYWKRQWVTQLNEQWFIDVGGVTTAKTSDLADEVVSAYVQDNLGTYTFPDGELVLRWGGKNTDSVIPTAVCLTPVEPPLETTTTTAPPVTTTTKAPTTTTEPPPETTTTTEAPPVTTTAPPPTTTLPPSQGDADAGAPLLPLGFGFVGALLLLAGAALIGARRTES